MNRREFIGVVPALPFLVKLLQAESLDTLRINGNLVDFEDLMLDTVDGRCFLHVRVKRLEKLWDVLNDPCGFEEIDMNYVGLPKRWQLSGYSFYDGTIEDFTFQDLESYVSDRMVRSQEVHLFHERYMLDFEKIVRGYYEPA